MNRQVALAQRLGVSQRTLRRDVAGLQELGYPMLTTRGTGGGYRLGAGAALLPLVLTEEEAAATVLGLAEVATGGLAVSGEAALSALAKIVQVLPARISGRVASLAAVAREHAPTGATIRDITALTEVALACRDSDTVEFVYESTRSARRLRSVQPHQVVNVEGRLYLLAWDLDRGNWRTFRIDRLAEPRRTGRRFGPRRLPAESAVEYVRAQLGAVPADYVVRATAAAPAELVREHLGHYGTVEPGGGGSSEVRINAASLDWAAFSLASIGAPFVVHGPAEAIEHLRGWAERLGDAAGEAAPRPSRTATKRDDE